MSETLFPIPTKARQSFEMFDGIPLSVIGELFSRMQVPEDLRSSFWKQAALKQLKSIKGKVERIDTGKDGSTIVHVLAVDGTSQFFCHPEDMSDQQLDEFKRAQNHGLKVRVMYQQEEDGRPVNEVCVYGRE